jgi:hypothetical protein
MLGTLREHGFDDFNTDVLGQRPSADHQLTKTLSLFDTRKIRLHSWMIMTYAVAEA